MTPSYKNCTLMPFLYGATGHSASLLLICKIRLLVLALMTHSGHLLCQPTRHCHDFPYEHYFHTQNTSTPTKSS